MNETEARAPISPGAVLSRALLSACENDPQAKISVHWDLGRIVGIVLWSGFEKTTMSKRQDLIWRHIDDAFPSPSDRAAISFIITDTPEAWKELQD